MSLDTATTSAWQFVWIQAVQEAWKDPNFAQWLKSDPRAALKDRFSFEVPKDMNFQVVDAKDLPKGETSCMTLALPPPPSNEKDYVIKRNDLADATAKNCCGHPCC